MRLMQDLVGEVLSGRYLLVARLAGGGMGEVYRAHDLLLDRDVAVKVLQHSLSKDGRVVERFRSEARIAARLSHPNAVAVYDWGSEDETYYMVMEYVSGSDLRDLLVAKGALEPAQAADIVASVCDGLAAAHSKGLVHRDIKPENVLIARDGTVKVADFGIAAVADAERTLPGGVISGTLRYLAPEQAQGLEGTPASDIWATGALLSELLTGRPPLQGAGAELLRRRAVESPVPPSTVEPTVPRELDDIVMTACALDPAGRFRSASEMANALRRVSARALPDAPPIEALLEDLTGEIDLSDLEAPASVSRERKRQGSRRSRRRMASLRRAVVVVAVVLVAAGVARAATTLMTAAEVEVPRLVGLSRGEARERAERLGLEVEVARRRADTEMAKGHVLRQRPSRGVVEEGDTVFLTISTGPPVVDVPSVVGDKLAVARMAIRDAGLRVGDVENRYSPKPVGTVIERTPRGRNLRWGTEVALVVSRGPRPLEVPALAGWSGDDAVVSLENTGLVPVVTEVYSEDVEEGLVISTDPPAGTLVPRGDDVAVVVSLGPELRELELPDLRNMSVDDARSKLERAGLRARVMRSCKRGNVVVETDPVAGSTVYEGDLIALFVC